MEQKTRRREDIPKKDTWRLEDIFETDVAWEEAFAGLLPLTEELEQYRGSVTEDAQHLADCLEKDDLLAQHLMDCYAYARMRKDQDNGNPTYQALFERVSDVLFKVQAQTAFLSPEIAHADEPTLRRWMDEEPRLGPFRQPLDRLLGQKAHILDDKQERLLAQAGPLAEGVGDAFTMLDNVDLKYGSMEDADGNTVELTNGRFARFRESKDRSVRSTAFRKVHETYAGVGNTLGTLYATNVKSDLFFSNARNHETALDAALFSDRLDRNVYTGLIDAVNESLPVMHRYLDLRRKILDLPDLHIYDTYIPIVEAPEKTYSFDEACAIVKDGVGILGDTYSLDLDRLFTDRWIDVYENEGKTSGAFAWGTYSSHPFMLLNFSGGLMDVLTLAHEAGHCLHSLYSNRQPHPTASYPIFLAEIASTVNENLVIRTLMDRCDTATPEGRREKAYLINRLIEAYRLTVFRQTMFAEFEWTAHRMAQEGSPLTAQTLCGVYENLLRAHFGPDTVLDDYMTWEWARIPHFYSAFYVFKYATGFCAAAAFTKMMNDEGRPAVDRYLGFLGSGGSDYPLNILKKAGLDMSGPDAVRASLAQLDGLVDELESLLGSEKA